jgi:hypothetical protein
MKAFDDLKGVLGASGVDHHEGSVVRARAAGVGPGGCCCSSKSCTAVAS